MVPTLFKLFVDTQPERSSRFRNDQDKAFFPKLTRLLLCFCNIGICYSVAVFVEWSLQSSACIVLEPTLDSKCDVADTWSVDLEVDRLGFGGFSATLSKGSIPVSTACLRLLQCHQQFYPPRSFFPAQPNKFSRFSRCSVLRRTLVTST